MEQCFIEVIGWNKNWVLNKFLVLKKHLLCIRYDKDFYFCIINKSPCLVKSSKIKRVTYKFNREVSFYQLLCGKEFLSRVLDGSEIINDDKEFLRKYVKVIIECQMK